MLTAVWHMLSDGAALIGVQMATRIDEAATAATDAARASPTYAVLAIVRELLQMPDDKRTSCATLAQIRDELVSHRREQDAKRTTACAGPQRKYDGETSDGIFPAGPPSTPEQR